MFHACLPMYDWPELHADWDRLWLLTRERLAETGIDAEPALRREGDFHNGWRNRDLILGQTCGWPFVCGVHEYVEPLARFDFDLETDQRGNYSSVFISRPDVMGPLKSPLELEEPIRAGKLRIAVNALNSQSGYRVLGECLSEPFTLPPAQALISGSHRDSIRAVARGEADLAAIDGVTWLVAQDHEPAAGQVRVVARSSDAPGLPLITAKGHAPLGGAITDAIGHAIAVMAPAQRRSLHIEGVVGASARDYDRLKDPPFGNLVIG